MGEKNKPSLIHQSVFKIFKDMMSTAISGPYPQSSGLNATPGSTHDLFVGSASSQLDQLNAIGDLPAIETRHSFEGPSSTTRQQRYGEAESMEEIIPEVPAALNLYADETVGQDEGGNVLKVICSNSQVKQECEFTVFEMWDMNDRLWGFVRNGCAYGDSFLEHVVDPKQLNLGIIALKELPPETMWRIESKRDTLLEFQQSLTQPNYSVVIDDIKKKAGIYGSNIDGKIMMQYGYGGANVSNSKNVIRFAPQQLTHIRLGAKRKGVYPYGTSILWPVRRTVHSLKLMEDAMLVYRLTRAPERRVFYVDVGNMQGNKVEGFVQRFKDTIKKKKVFNEKSGAANEIFNPWGVDEDLFLPKRGDAGGSRVETLPGAQHLGDIDDTIYFKRKFWTGLNIHYTQIEQGDMAQTRVSVSARDISFARVIARIQRAWSHAVKQALRIHLTLRGYPPESHSDLQIILTPPSDWQEIARAEVLSSRIDRASSAKAVGLFSDLDILVNEFKYSAGEAKEIVRRRRSQAVEEAEMQTAASIASDRARIDAGVSFDGQPIDQTDLKSAISEPQPVDISSVGTPEELVGLPPSNGDATGILSPDDEEAEREER